MDIGIFHECLFLFHLLRQKSDRRVTRLNPDLQNLIPVLGSMQQGTVSHAHAALNAHAEVG